MQNGPLLEPFKQAIADFHRHSEILSLSQPLVPYALQTFTAVHHKLQNLHPILKDTGIYIYFLGYLTQKGKSIYKNALF